MDINAILEKYTGLIPSALKMTSGVSKYLSDTITYEFRNAHNEYCTALIKKYCRARTFFVRDEPQYLDEFYVPSTIKAKRDKFYARADLATLDTVTGKRTIITGTGGSGKTIFMRHLLLNAIETGSGYPVFIELRSLTQDDYGDMEGVITKFMSDHGFPLARKYVSRSISEGLLVILLDGFDEVPYSQRKKLEKSIKKMVSNCESRIIISSRPDIVLEGWDDFTTVKIAPLSMDDACELVEKIRYEGEVEVKERFINSLRSGLFTSHQYFLSNPLLLSIMLLTYGDSADIPKKFASFYEQAFTALFQKHDALKSGYRRERKSDLDLYSFARLFSAFCAVTYKNKNIRFSSLAAIEFANKAKAIAAMPEVNSDDFINDAKQVVCLLIEDGLDLTFVHRSFQEYFVARFVNEASEDVRKAYIKSMSSDGGITSENILVLLYEISPHQVEEDYLIPGLNGVFGKEKLRKINQVKWKEIYKKMFNEVQFGEDGSNAYVLNNAGLFALALFMKKIMKEKFPSVNSDKSDSLVNKIGEDPIFISSLSLKSPVWSSIAHMKGDFGMDLFEMIRQELISMEARNKARREAISEALNF
ncbi:NACHT domain-containing protein [Xanthomonas campestris pv. raphani]|uniref:NACHT domain-containing protein n=1 Tax=Xanthomonas campestris TaxID=339 RepID=UPI001E2EDDDB|nr:NACHT domain-containing protein [Xanthomonas campestris]MCC8488065.1 NACHT domain-containing protein [Xanthomonas campestris]MEA9649574.1 NACHT domain-containing protein [Xanthomonas campestris pv. raphani]MEA9743076.1 NACHT domain-containing protein [Xanthomonas campestris pv. raphani]MEA9766644.1 NACHT domain-containing protein [Xanthomonas campestris pv. raphani]MEA9770955.1 NACHT domain-containing protein [Xanthomonas campestris pv. raphani]